MNKKQKQDLITIINGIPVVDLEKLKFTELWKKYGEQFCSYQFFKKHLKTMTTIQELRKNKKSISNPEDISKHNEEVSQ